MYVAANVIVLTVLKKNFVEPLEGDGDTADESSSTATSAQKQIIIAEIN